MVKIENKYLQKESVVCSTKKYKPVVLKVRSILSALPSRFRIVQNIQDNPLEEILELLKQQPEFMPKKWYLLKRREKMNKVFT